MVSKLATMLKFIKFVAKKLSIIISQDYLAIP